MRLVYKERKLRVKQQCFVKHRKTDQSTAATIEKKNAGRVLQRLHRPSGLFFWVFLVFAEQSTEVTWDVGRKQNKFPLLLLTVSTFMKTF